MRKSRWALITLAVSLLAVVAVASEAGAAQTAASIQYDFVGRPAGLPADFDAPPGASLRFLAIKAIDGFQVDAALWQPHLLVQNEENFRQLSEAAFQSLRDGKPGEILPVRMGWITGEKVPLTGQHFLTYRWEPSSVADGTFWIKRSFRPILMVRDEGDPIIQPFEPYMLLSAATSEGSLVPSIKFVLLPNPKGRNPAAHGFADNKQPLVDAVAAWLAERRL